MVKKQGFDCPNHAHDDVIFITIHGMASKTSGIILTLCTKIIILIEACISFNVITITIMIWLNKNPPAHCTNLKDCSSLSNAVLCYDEQTIDHYLIPPI